MEERTYRIVTKTGSFDIEANSFTLDESVFKFFVKTDAQPIGEIVAYFNKDETYGVFDVSCWVETPPSS